MLADNPDVTRKLRAVWALHAIGGLDDASSRALLDHASEYVRAWAMRLLVEDRKVGRRRRWRSSRKMAADDASPLCGCYLASALQRLPSSSGGRSPRRWRRHAEDAQDPNLPLMIWYGVEPVVPTNKPRAAALMAKVKIPLVREHIARRLAKRGQVGVVPHPTTVSRDSKRRPHLPQKNALRFASRL